MEIVMHAIGIIHSPFNEKENTLTLVDVNGHEFTVDAKTGKEVK